jgi:hypothetical protein
MPQSMHSFNFFSFERLELALKSRNRRETPAVQVASVSIPFQLHRKSLQITKSLPSNPANSVPAPPVSMEEEDDDVEAGPSDAMLAPMLRLEGSVRSQCPISVQCLWGVDIGRFREYLHCLNSSSESEEESSSDDEARSETTRSERTARDIATSSSSSNARVDDAGDEDDDDERQPLNAEEGKDEGQISQQTLLRYYGRPKGSDFLASSSSSSSSASTSTSTSLSTAPDAMFHAAHGAGGVKSKGSKTKSNARMGMGQGPLSVAAARYVSPAVLLDGGEEDMTFSLPFHPLLLQDWAHSQEQEQGSESPEPHPSVMNLPVGEETKLSDAEVSQWWKLQAGTTVYPCVLSLSSIPQPNQPVYEQFVVVHFQCDRQGESGFYQWRPIIFKHLYRSVGEYSQGGGNNGIPSGEMWEINPIWGWEGNQQGPAPSEEQDLSASGSDDDNECVVCLSEDVTVVLLPCRHACLCAQCCERIDVCPICRSRIGAYLSDVPPEQKDEDGEACEEDATL